MDQYATERRQPVPHQQPESRPNIDIHVRLPCTSAHHPTRLRYFAEGHWMAEGSLFDSTSHGRRNGAVRSGPGRRLQGGSHWMERTEWARPGGDARRCPASRRVGIARPLPCGLYPSVRAQCPRGSVSRGDRVGNIAGRGCAWGAAAAGDLAHPTVRQPLPRAALRCRSTRARSSACCCGVQVRNPSPDFMPSLPWVTRFSR